MELYSDGTPISEHPSQEEIFAHWDYWYWVASEEQREILEGMYDLGAMAEWQKIAKKLQKNLVVTEAMKFWMRAYPWEVRDYMNYVGMMRECRNNEKGFDRGKTMMFVGSIPDRVKHMVGLVDQEMLQVDRIHKTSQMQRDFFRAFNHLRVGGKI